MNLIGPASSTGSPMTFMMRPSVPSPTGTEMALPVSFTCWPRTRPSVASIATVRTVDSPRCCATSSTSRLPLIVGLERVHDLRQFAFELHVDDGAHDLRHAAELVAHLFVHGAALFHFRFERGGLDGDAPFMTAFVKPDRSFDSYRRAERLVTRLSPEQLPNEFGQTR